MSFLSLASPGERNDPGLTNRGAGTSASRRALSASSVERTRLGRKCGRGYIGGINRIPIRGTCHLTASENLKSYSRDYSSPVTPGAELPFGEGMLRGSCTRVGKLSCSIRGERVDRKANTVFADSPSICQSCDLDLPLPSLASSVPKFQRSPLEIDLVIGALSLILFIVIPRCLFRLTKNPKIPMHVGKMLSVTLRI